MVWAAFRSTVFPFAYGVVGLLTAVVVLTREQATELSRVFGALALACFVVFLAQLVTRYVDLSGAAFRPKVRNLAREIAALAKEFRPLIDRFVLEPENAEAETQRLKNLYFRRFYRRLEGVISEGIKRGRLTDDVRRPWLYPQTLFEMLCVAEFLRALSLGRLDRL